MASPTWGNMAHGAMDEDLHNSDHCPTLGFSMGGGGGGDFMPALGPILHAIDRCIKDLSFEVEDADEALYPLIFQQGQRNYIII